MLKLGLTCKVLLEAVDLSEDGTTENPLPRVSKVKPESAEKSIAPNCTERGPIEPELCGISTGFVGI